MEIGDRSSGHGRIWLGLVWFELTWLDLTCQDVVLISSSWHQLFPLWQEMREMANWVPLLYLITLKERSNFPHTALPSVAGIFNLLFPLWQKHEKWQPTVGNRICKMSDRQSSALPSLAKTSSILNHLKRARILPRVTLPSVAEIANFHRRALTVKRKKVEISQKKIKNPPPVLTTDKCRNCRITRNLLGLGNAEIGNPKRGRGTPIFPPPKTGLLDALNKKPHQPQASAVKTESVFPENPNRRGAI